MKNHEIQAVLLNAVPLQEVRVINNGNHFQIVAVGKIFNGMSNLKKHQTIYAPLIEYISDNRIHALSVVAYTPEEWERNRKLNGF